MGMKNVILFVLSVFSVSLWFNRLRDQRAAAALLLLIAFFVIALLVGAKRARLGPDHAVAGVFSLAEVNHQRQLFHAGDRHVDRERFAGAAQVGLGEQFSAVAQYANHDPPAAGGAFVETDQGFE